MAPNQALCHCNRFHSRREVFLNSRVSITGRSWAILSCALALALWHPGAPAYSGSRVCSDDAFFCTEVSLFVGILALLVTTLYSRFMWRLQAHFVITGPFVLYFRCMNPGICPLVSRSVDAYAGKAGCKRRERCNAQGDI